MSPLSGFPKGTRVVIGATDNEFAKRHVGKAGVVVGEAPLGMIAIDLDDGMRDYWAKPYNVRRERKEG